MKTFVTRFHPRDVLKIKLRARDLKDTEGLSPLAWAYIFEQSGQARTLMREDGEVVACGGGIIHFGGGCADFWTLTSDLVHDHFKSFAASCASVIMDNVRMYGLHRIQAYTLALDDGGRDQETDRFMEWLGFEWEGFCRKTGPNALDRHLYARVTQ